MKKAWWENQRKNMEEKGRKGLTDLVNTKVIIITEKTTANMLPVKENNKGKILSIPTCINP